MWFNCFDIEFLQKLFFIILCLKLLLMHQLLWSWTLTLDQVCKRSLTLRVSFWSAHLDETCCFHLTFLETQSESFFRDYRKKIATTLMILSKKSYHEREASREFWTFNWVQKSRQAVWFWKTSNMILLLKFMCWWLLKLL